MDLQPRVSIFDTLTAKATINNAQLTELVNFLALNRSLKMDAAAVKMMLGVRSLTSTAISAVFTRALELHRESLFSFVKIPSTVLKTPEVVTYTHIAFDMKQLKTVSDMRYYDMIRSIPEFANMIFANVTPLLKRTGEPIDVSSIQSLVVRDLLSRSYYDNKTGVWLNPSLLRYLCRFYNMSLSTAVGLTYSLTYPQMQIVATVASIFFLQLVSDVNSAESMVRNAKDLGLGLPQQVSDIIARMKEVLGDEYNHMTLDSVCTVLGQLGIDRLQSVTRAFFNQRLRAIGENPFISAMALEYPPYWCFVVLQTISGRKNGLRTTFKTNDIQKKATSFVDELVQTQSFLPAL